MARYDHLPLRRLEGELPRRKRPGFGKLVPRDSKVHGVLIAASVDAVVQAHKRRPRIAEIDPALILKVQMAGSVSEEEWQKLGLTLLADDPDKTLVLFANDAELRDFKQRVAAYQQNPPEGQKNPAYAAFIGAIEAVGELTPTDRIGPVLRAEGFTDPAQFADDQLETLDVELWQPNRELATLFVHRIGRRLEEAGGVLSSTYQGNAATLVRFQGNGTTIRALLDMPEVSSIDRPPLPDLPATTIPEFTIEDLAPAQTPPDGASVIGIVDSGITSAHPYLEPAVAGSFSVPATLGDDDAKGHGTPVSGIAIYGDVRQRLTSRQLNPRFRLASAKVVNANGKFDDRLLVPQQMEDAIRRLHDEFGCRVINISLGDQSRPVNEKPSSWAAILDELARELNLVIVVSAGNRKDRLEEFGDRVVAAYPRFLVQEKARILEPASAINVLTVGSIAHANGLTEDDVDFVGVRPIAERDQPSPFTLSGPGIGKMIKPDLVDYGGTAVFDGPTQRVQDGTLRPAAGVLTLHHRYLERLFTSLSGTSFAGPLVAYKAALVLETFPQASANLVRALLALSADHPEAALACLASLDKEALFEVCGYGVANVERAIGSDENRVVLYREDVLPVDRFAVFEIPIPPVFQTQKGLRRIRVALAFDPPVRHTRLDYAGLSMGFHLIRGATEGEVFDAFRQWEASEGTAFTVPLKLKCSVKPGPQTRERGCLQCGMFTAKQNIEQYGDRYFLAVRCEGGWAASSVEQQRFAVAVELAHEAQINLYQRIAERVRVRA